MKVDDAKSDGVYRLNPRFDFTEMRDTSPGDNVIYKSPFCSPDPPTSNPFHPVVSVTVAADSQPRGSSQMFRKFLSEPSLANNPPRHSACGFRERMRADCLEEAPPDFRRGISDTRADNTRRRISAKKRTCSRHDCPSVRRGQSKSRQKVRRPLSDCSARLNSSLAGNVASTVEEEASPSLSEEDVRAVCVDIFLER